MKWSQWNKVNVHMLESVSVSISVFLQLFFEESQEWIDLFGSLSFSGSRDMNFRSEPQQPTIHHCVQREIGQ